MQNIIRNLFRGNLDILDRPFSETSRQSIAFGRMETITRQAKQKIPQEYHSILDEWEKAMLELMDAACEDDFIAGYRLGIHMLLAAWPGQQN